MALLLVAALSLNALVLPTPAHAPTRAAIPHMNEARAKAAWLARLDQPSWGFISSTLKAAAAVFRAVWAVRHGPRHTRRAAYAPHEN